MPIIRSPRQHSWLLWGLALLALAVWGRPLIQSTQFENHFFGLFYYSILAGLALFWALPSEQRLIAGQFQRRTLLLGLLPIRTLSAPVSAFREIRLEQDPNLFRRDTVWLMICGEPDNPEQVARFAFAHWPASARNIAAASKLQAELAAATGLSIMRAEDAAAE
ncbi:hypothetical protein [Chitinibacter sp. ZOR0017]|uniref:hypothetical protein n=1 Tax=Chitinibacter sp. ZOR0017 TaxID=1339254 RepID=UPI0006473AA2|nr:hypothetical protein [Chitinibacter sp. ZOR0017]